MTEARRIGVRMGLVVLDTSRGRREQLFVAYKNYKVPICHDG